VTRLLGVDLGDKRIGLALADPATDPPRPYATVPRADTVEQDAAMLRAIVERQGVVEVILGLPLDFDGAEGTQATKTRAWGDRIAAILGLPVLLCDERLSSDRAAREIGPMKRGRSGGPPTPAQRRAYRERLDREAAAIILRDELDARAGKDL
jgi:putative holliday junction resolvase